MRLKVWQGYLKKETKNVHIIAQDQTLATNTYMVTTLNKQSSKKCRMSVMSILGKC